MSPVEATARQRRLDFTAKSTKEKEAVELRPSNVELFFVISALIVAQSGKTLKPTVGFLARFILEGSGRWLRLQGNGLRRRKSRKSEKTRKKVQNNFRGTPVLLPKRARFTG
jgi:hypothetical protein